MIGRRASLVVRLTLVVGALGALLGGAYLWYDIQREREEFERHASRVLEATSTEFRAVTDRQIDTDETYRETLIDSLIEAGAAQLEDTPLGLYRDEAQLKKALLDQWRARADSKRAAAQAVGFEIRRRVGDEVDRRLATLARTSRDEGSRVLEASSRRAWWSAGGAAVALIVAIGLGLYVTVIRPARRLTQSAERIASGDLEHRAAVERDDEFGRLAGSFNAMVESLNSAIAEVESLNVDLERRVAEKSAQLAHASKMSAIGTLSGGVAHEFNNLLGGILGSAEAALEEEDLGPEARRAVEMIQRTATRATDITKNLLRFSRSEEDETRAVALDAVLDDAIALASPTARARKVAVVRTGEAPAPAARVAGALQTVLVNLLVNAIHASDAEQRVEISARIAADADDVEIRVRDRGPGIPVDDRDRVFEPFFTTKAPDQGTGLGLSVSYGIVERLGGSLAFTCPDDGGTEFVVRLPRLDRRPT